MVLGIDITVVHFIILSLATWRISSLLVDEDGIFDMFERLRTFVGIRYMKGETGEPERVILDDVKGLRKIVAGWLTCRWCCSLWLGGLLTGLYVMWPSVVYFILPWSLSGLAVVIDAVIGRRYRRRVYFG